MATDSRLETLTLADDLTITRMGYGAMQLAGPGVFGPPKDRDQAIAVLRKAVERGLTHIDTSDFYGPAVVNELIKEALHPYPADLHIVTKVGARRDDRGGWIPSLAPADLKDQVHENLQHLGLETLDVVNLRLPSVESTSDESIAERFGVLAELRGQGLIRHLGLSGASDAQLTEAQAIAPVVTVQNLYNLANRQSEDVLDYCTEQGIGFIPWYPLAAGELAEPGGPVAEAAQRHDATPGQVALAWLLARSPVMLPIPGTGSVEHLEENAAAVDLQLDQDELEAIAAAAA
jgi:aryl-alcohol dehydrogenase-like predicted oxidoreductase